MSVYRPGTNKSSILNYPTIRPTLDLDFANSKTLDPRITFARSSGGSYVGPDGLIKYAGVNEARFDHDPVTGESLGLLIEESRTNLLTYSQDFSNVNWSQFNLTTSLSNVLSPDGVSYSYKLTENSTNDFKFTVIGVTMGTGSHTVSAWMKAAERTQGSIFITQGGNLGAIFDLSKGTVATVSGPENSASIVAYPNGWYRCSVTNNGTLDINDSIRIGINNGAIGSYQGDGSSGIYVWGAQVEQGSFPTSYIPTGASTRTRAAEDASITGRNFSSFYNQSEGTVYVNTFRYFSNSLPGAGIWELSNSDRSRLMTLFGRANGATGFQLASAIDSISTFDVTPTGVLSPNTYTKIAFGLKFREIYSSASYNNNVFLLNDHNQTTPPLLPVTQLRLGPYSNYHNAHILRLVYYPKKLPNAQLQALTR